MRRLIGILATSVAVGALCVMTDVSAIARGGGGGGGAAAAGVVAFTGEAAVGFTAGVVADSMAQLAAFMVVVDLLPMDLLPMDLLPMAMA